MIPIFIAAALRGEPPTIDGDGEQTRDFTYVDNVVRANMLALAAPDEALGRVFNVGCGHRISINRLWQEIRRLTGAQVEAGHGPPRGGDVRDSLASLDLAQRVLDYRPTVGLNEGLSERAQKALIGRVPTARLVEPRDIAAVVIFLLSDGASQINGATIAVHGGSEE